MGEEVIQPNGGPSLAGGSPLRVGDRFGRLLVTATVPLVALCDCGQLVTDRKAYHLSHNRLRSCGCLKRERIAVPHESATWTGIRCLNPGEKVRFQRFAVTCKRCNQPSEVGYPALVTRKQPLHGCTRCAVAHRRGRWAVPISEIEGRAVKAALRAAAKAAAGDAP
jgi:hypothetical protein